jgi:hypothetical protein
VFVGAFLGVFFAGLLAAAKRGDDLLAMALKQERAAMSSALTGDPRHPE